MFVLDASLYVATISETDRFRQRSARWLEACLREGASLFAPSLFAVEIAAAIRRLSGSRTVAERAVARLRDKAFIELLPLTWERAQEAAEVAARTGLRGADAVYVALARELGATLVTLDRQQLERGSGIADVRRP